MTGEIHRFDPSTYDARFVNKPLSQLMREAERERSETAVRLFAALWREIKSLFRSRKAVAAEQAKDEDRRLAA